MIQSALIIKEPYATQIVTGVKRWELRSTATHKRETVGIISAGSGKVIGLVDIIASHGPLSEQDLREKAALHKAPPEVLAAHPEWDHGWELANPVELPEPVVYNHPPGAQGWVRIGPATALKVAYQARPATRPQFGGHHH